jgi:protein involved in polysaccharide export with SLBB domain
MRNFKCLSIATAGLILVLSSACSSAPHSEREFTGPKNARPETQKTGKASGRGAKEVAPGFEIELSSMEDRALNGKYRIDFDGQVKLPYNVTVEAAGLELSDLQQKIVSAYRSFFKTPPTISVTIAERKFWVETRGLVEKPAQYLVRGTTSLDEIIATSGGLQKTGNVKYVRIEQPGNSVTIKLSDYYGGANRDLLPRWMGGDHIYFLSDSADVDLAQGSDSGYLQLLGEVKTPGEYRYKRDSDFYYYLSKAGGPTERANLGRIELVRGTPKNRSTSLFDLGDPATLPPLSSGDLIIVHADKQTPTERTIGTISGITAILNSILLGIILLVR